MYYSLTNYAMGDKYKDLDITFHPHKKLGKLGFSFREEDVLTVLGWPSEREIYYYNTPISEDEKKTISPEPIQYSINMFYPHMAVFIGYADNKFQGTTIHIDDLILDGHRLSEMYKEDVLDLLENYHYKNGITFQCQTSYAESLNEECYEYDNLGLTLWYVKDGISDICVMHPKAWEAFVEDTES